jgi:hypothetical protein
VLIPEEVWQKLFEWYGLAENQRAISRRVVDYGVLLKNPKVEIYKTGFKICLPQLIQSDAAAVSGSSLLGGSSSNSDKTCG